jgi:Ca2+-binding EF-hand superfamily protein
MTNYENRIRSFSSPEKVFSVFASVSKDGHMYMTVDDFIRALIPHEHSALLAQRSDNRKHTYHALPAAFKIADQNDDGLISFEEYLFFVTLLSIPEQSFKVAFRMLDVNDDGQVDQHEFMKMIKFLRVASPHAQQTRTSTSGVAQGWLTHYFGENASKLTFDTFTTFLQQLKSDVLRLEFNLYDPQELGYISQRDFGMLLVSYARSKNLLGYVQRASTLEATPLKIFDFEQFQNFNMLLEHIHEVETAMQLYQMNGRAFKKQDLRHLSKIVCGTKLNQQVIDTMMSIFDSNNDGTLDLDEFVTALKRRKARGLSEPRDTGFLRKLEKIMKCAREG